MSVKVFMPKILTICPYKLLPPRGGGALRCFHLLRELSRYHEVHAIIFQKEEELRKEKNGYKIPDSVKIYSPIDSPPPQSFFGKLPRRIGPGLHFRWLRHSWRGPAESTLLKCHHLAEEIVTNNKIDVAIYEHISSMHAAPLIKRLSPKTIRILDAHNIDHKLLAKEIESSNNSIIDIGLKIKALKNTRWIENNLQKYVHSFWACSDDDRRFLDSLNKITGFTIPNGIDTMSLPLDVNPNKAFNKEIIFCGSLGYTPNRDGLYWFHKNVWPKIKALENSICLRIIGRGGHLDAFSSLNDDPDVKLTGEVPEVQPYYENAGVAVVPLRMGSGTRLKILEAMSLGNPVVTTSIGAEGIEVVNGKHVLINDNPDVFAKAVVHLLSNNYLFNQIRTSARKLVETKYDWNVIGRQMNLSIQELLGTQNFTKH